MTCNWLGSSCLHQKGTGESCVKLNSWQRSSTCKLLSLSHNYMCETSSSYYPDTHPTLIICPSWLRAMRRTVWERTLWGLRYLYSNKWPSLKVAAWEMRQACWEKMLLNMKGFPQELLWSSEKLRDITMVSGTQKSDEYTMYGNMSPQRIRLALATLAGITLWNKCSLSRDCFDFSSFYDFVSDQSEC